MKLLYALCACLWLTVHAGVALAEGKTLVIAADVWCPINCDPKVANQEGIGIDLARRVFEPLGYRIKYVIMPWSRALEEVRAGKIDAVIGATVKDDPSLVFPKHSVQEAFDDFYVLADNPLVFKNMESLKGQRLGVIQDYGYSDEVVKFVVKQRNVPDAIQEVSGDRALEQNIKKLLAKRIDVVVENRPVMEYRLKRLGLEKEVRRIGSIPQGSIYLAFSPALESSKWRAAEYDRGIDRLKQQKALKPLYAAYEMKP